MRSLTRPPAPDGFELDAQKHLDDFHAQLTLALASVPFGKEHISNLFKGREHWRDCKVAFERPGYLARCGYCERFRDLKGELHVDHFRPKSEVAVWTATPSEVSDVPPAIQRVGLGFWWLAYRWHNLVLACWTCNAAWKRTLFPVDPATSLPLLLHPFEPFATGKHFCWDRSGHIASRTPQGRATIITCGLNRRELVEARMKVFQDVSEATDRYIDAFRGGSTEEIARRERRLLLLGSGEREFTGMIRWIIEDRLCGVGDELFDD